MADTTHALDGNAAAGALADLFAAEMTAAMTTCANCGDTRPLGELRTYPQAPGVILRCITCDTVQLRLVRAPQQAWLDLRGIQVLQITIPQDPPTSDTAVRP
jgi:hypothetical protein